MHQITHTWIRAADNRVVENWIVGFPPAIDRTWPACLAETTGCAERDLTSSMAVGGVAQTLKTVQL